MAEENKKALEIDVFGCHKAAVTWFCNAVKTSKKSRTIIDLGYCSYGEAVAFISVYNPNRPTQDFLKPLVVKDVFVQVEKKTCEDVKWCFNLSCALNRADLNNKTFRRYGIRKRVQLENLHALLENISKELKLEPKPFGTLVEYQKAPIYINAPRK